MNTGKIIDLLDFDEGGTWIASKDELSQKSMSCECFTMFNKSDNLTEVHRCFSQLVCLIAHHFCLYYPLCHLSSTLSSTPNLVFDRQKRFDTEFWYYTNWYSSIFKLSLPLILFYTSLVLTLSEGLLRAWEFKNGASR